VKRVLTAVVLIPLVVIALFRAPLWLFTLLVLGVALLAAREYLDIAQSNGLSPFRKLCYLFLACVFLVTFAAGQMMSVNYQLGVSLTVASAASWALLLLIASPFILMVLAMRREPLSQALPDSAVSFLILPYIGVSLASMVLVRSYSNGALFLLYVMLLVWTGDTAAYYVGRAIGRRKLAPRISPGKSWEGTIASAVAASVVAVVLFRYVVPIHDALSRIGLIVPVGYTWYRPLTGQRFVPAPAGLVILFGLCVNVAAQLGDLVESMLKRGGGVKNSGALLPGHGGLLDRIDALLFAAPVGCFFYLAVLGKYFRWMMVAD
jgi:phosphatidate cytidylyltransferase